MRRLWSLLIALLCSMLALAGSFYCGLLFLLLFDPHYHDGVAAVGGFIIGITVAVFVFMAIWRKLGA
jgi:hypothetical protein